MNKTLYIILAFVVFVYLTLRAIYVPLVHDEIATFFYYIQQLDWNPLAGANPDANNHILNSILAGISHKFFGYSAFSIRLPNLLSFIPYAFFVFKIGQKLTRKSSRWAFYIGMLFPIYFIQFFALSRGYGMSMAFLIGAIYYILNLYDKKSLTSLSLAIVCMLLGVYANMSVLPLVMILVVVIIVLVLRKKQEYFNPLSLTVSTFFSSVFVVLMYYAIKISFKMKEEGSLYYGELDGFWEITIKSELLMLFENSAFITQLILAIVLVLLLVIYVFKLSKDKLHSIFNPNYLFFYLLIGIMIGIELMAKILEINYPEDRVGMYLYPLLLGTLCFGVDSMKLKWSSLFLIPVLIIPIHFIVSINFDKTSQWKSGYIPTRFFEAIKNHKTETKYPTTVSGDAQRIFIYTNKIYLEENTKENNIQLWEKTIYDSNFNLNVLNHPGKYADYLVTNSKYIKSISSLYDSIDGAKLTGFGLFKRNKIVKKQLLSKTNKFKDGEVSDEYFEFYHQTFDSLNYDAVMLGFNLKIQSLSHPFKGRIAVEIRDKKTGDKLEYQYFQLNWMYPKMEKVNPIIKSMYFNNLKHYSNNGPIEIVAYLWNIDKKPFSIYKGEMEVYKVLD